MDEDRLRGVDGRPPVPQASLIVPGAPVAGVPAPPTASLLPDALRVVVLTAFVYICTYAFEVTYCAQLRIPTCLIIVTPSTIIDAMTAAAVPLVGCAVAFVFPRLIPWSPRLKPIDDRLRMVVPVFFAGLICASMFGFRPVSTRAWLAILAIALLPFAAWPFGKPGYVRRLADADRRFHASRAQDPFVQMFQRVSPRDLYGAFAGAVIFVFSGGAGQWVARTEVAWTAVVGTDFVILRNYGDTFIAAETDPETKLLSTNIHVWQRSDLAGKLLASRLIGPLASDAPLLMNLEQLGIVTSKLPPPATPRPLLPSMKP